MKKFIKSFLAIFLMSGVLIGCTSTTSTSTTSTSTTSTSTTSSISTKSTDNTDERQTLIVKDGGKVLFLGNSFTYVNDLPEMFNQLAIAGGHKIVVDSITEGGAKLNDFNNSLATDLNNKLKDKWDIVVLQEQSKVPAIPKYRKEIMYPSIRELNKKIIKSGAKSMLYMTWGYRFGDKEDGYATFEDMQEALKVGYTNIGQELSIPVSPVGMAFLKAKEIDGNIELWDAEDDMHPTIKGTYLAACVFYAQLFGESPVGLKYNSKLSDEEAKDLQQVAADVVLNSK